MRLMVISPWLVLNHADRHNHIVRQWSALFQDKVLREVFSIFLVHVRLCKLCNGRFSSNALIVVVVWWLVFWDYPILEPNARHSRLDLSYEDFWMYFVRIRQLTCFLISNLLYYYVFFRLISMFCSFCDFRSNLRTKKFLEFFLFSRDIFTM